MLIPQYTLDKIHELSTLISDLEWQLQFEEDNTKQLHIHKQLVSLMKERDCVKDGIIRDFSEEVLDFYLDN